MPEWALILMGILIGLGLIVGVVWLAVRNSESPSRLAKPSGREDTGPSVGTNVDPSD